MSIIKNSCAYCEVKDITNTALLFVRGAGFQPFPSLSYDKRNVFGDVFTKPVYDVVC
eukprot:m.99731 g.99731  ORF g.99731 m.99731 type:complete len:57 (-) comp13681_c0_seq2:1101-1271(-)